jgi:uncharacterized protein YbjT (DUF2867 family)
MMFAQNKKTNSSQQQSMSSNNTLFLIGGTGALGQNVAKGLITAEGFDSCVALVRNSTSDASQALEALGWTVTETDFSDPGALTASLEGAKTVVSTVGGGDMVAIELAVVAAAKQAGATLFVPSQYGVDFRRFGTSFPFLAAKTQVLKAAEDANLATLSVFVGYFSDYIFGLLADTENAKARVVGTGSGKMSFTRRSDIGYVLAKALADPAFAAGGFLSMEGDNKTWMEALQILETHIGKKIEIEYVDPQEALKQEQELTKMGLEGNMGAFYGAFALHLLGEPARGNTGVDLSAEANSYGVKLETLDETLQSVYGSN